MQKWQLLSKTDVSPSAHFPIEKRVYKLPSGKVIDDFFVTTVADVAKIIPVTKDKKLVLAKQFKPGANDIVLEFPAGRLDAKHTNLLELAQAELEEEVGIKTELSNLKHFATLTGFSTKGTEKVYFYLAVDLEFNGKQNFDDNEDIEVVTMSFAEFEEKVFNGEIWNAQTIAGYFIAKEKFPEIFKS